MVETSFREIWSIEPRKWLTFIDFNMFHDLLIAWMEKTRTTTSSTTSSTSFHYFSDNSACVLQESRLKVVIIHRERELWIMRAKDYFSIFWSSRPDDFTIHHRRMLQIRFFYFNGFFCEPIFVADKCNEDLRPVRVSVCSAVMWDCSATPQGLRFLHRFQSWYQALRMECCRIRFAILLGDVCCGSSLSAPCTSYRSRNSLFLGFLGKSVQDRYCLDFQYCNPVNVSSRVPRFAGTHRLLKTEHQKCTKSDYCKVYSMKAITFESDRNVTRYDPWDECFLIIRISRQ